MLLRPEVAKDLAGATPTGLALSPDEKTLYASLGDMNAVASIGAVADRGPGPSAGYVPAGWYPTAVAVTPDGKRLLVANAKGDRRPACRTTPTPAASVDSRRWTSSRAPSRPSRCRRRSELAELTQTRAGERPAHAALLPPGEPAEGHCSLTSDKPKKIRHVIYIVKENRTYDQVLGDLPQGNGDPNRCIFGRDVTPNLHALAERFVLLDNFYDSGEVSGDGWTWSTQAQANEYIAAERAVQLQRPRAAATTAKGQINDYPTGGFPAERPRRQAAQQRPALQERRQADPRRRPKRPAGTSGTWSARPASPTATTASSSAAA